MLEKNVGKLQYNLRKCIKNKCEVGEVLTVHLFCYAKLFSYNFTNEVTHIDILCKIQYNKNINV